MITFGRKVVGDGYPCFITFEAGPTHDGLETARKLVELAAQAGADAIKFQILDPERLVADKKQLFSYEILLDRATGKTETVSEPLYDILCRRVLTAAEWKKVKTHCEVMGIAFFATIGFEDEIVLLESIGCDSIKIASADVNHWPLIRKAARTGMCLQLDTGNASLGEVEAAVDVARAEGNEKIIVHNCPSGYPARVESINLNIIPTLKRMFSCPVAFSDHTPGRDMDVAAVALGANLIEKTITLDRTTPSVEHMFSLEPGEMERFIHAIRDVETALGNTRRILQPEERERRLAVRRSAFTKVAVPRGRPVTEAEIEFRRPGFGIAPDVFESMGDMHFGKDLPAGHMLKHGDLE